MIEHNTDYPYLHDIFDQYCNLFKDYKHCAKSNCEVLKILKENEQLKHQLENEKQLNAEVKKKLVEVEYDCEEFNHEYCDLNCSGKRKKLVDLYDLVSNGLNETLLKQKDEEIKRLEKENIQLKQHKIGTYDKNMHEFYNKVYDVHNELMELERENL